MTAAATPSVSCSAGPTPSGAAGHVIYPARAVEGAVGAPDAPNRAQFEVPGRHSRRLATILDARGGRGGQANALPTSFTAAAQLTAPCTPCDASLLMPAAVCPASGSDVVRASTLRPPPTSARAVAGSPAGSGGGSVSQSGGRAHDVDAAGGIAGGKSLSFDFATAESEAAAEAASAADYLALREHIEALRPCADALVTQEASVERLTRALEQRDAQAKLDAESRAELDASLASAHAELAAANEAMSRAVEGERSAIHHAENASDEVIALRRALAIAEQRAEAAESQRRDAEESERAAVAHGRVTAATEAALVAERSRATDAELKALRLEDELGGALNDIEEMGAHARQLKREQETLAEELTESRAAVAAAERRARDAKASLEAGKESADRAVALARAQAEAFRERCEVSEATHARASERVEAAGEAVAQQMEHLTACVRDFPEVVGDAALTAVESFYADEARTDIDEMREMREEMDQTAADMAEMQALNKQADARWRQAVSLLETRVHQLSQELREATARSASAAAECVNAQADIEAASKAALRQGRAQAERAATSAAEMGAREAARIAELEVKVRHLEERAGALNEELARAREAAVTATSRADALCEELARTRVAAAEAEARADAHLKEAACVNDASTKAHEMARVATEKALSEARAVSEAASAKMSRLKAKRDEAQARASELEDCVERLTDALEEAERAADAARSQSAEADMFAEAAADDLRKEHEETKQSLDAAVETLTASQSRCERITADCERVKVELQSAREDHAQTLSDLNACRTRVVDAAMTAGLQARQELEQEHAEAESHMREDFDAQLRARAQENDQLRASLAALAADINAERVQAQSMTTEAASTCARLKSLEHAAKHSIAMARSVVPSAIGSHDDTAHSDADTADVLSADLVDAVDEAVGMVREWQSALTIPTPEHTIPIRRSVATTTASTGFGALFSDPAVASALHDAEKKSAPTSARRSTAAMHDGSGSATMSATDDAMADTPASEAA